MGSKFPSIKMKVMMKKMVKANEVKDVVAFSINSATITSTAVLNETFAICFEHYFHH